MSVSANTPHLAATWCSLESSKCSDVTISGGALTLRKHLSIVAPVPEAHLSFIEAPAVFDAGLLVLFEHDDLRVLTAQLDDREHVGMQVLDRQGDGVHLLDELAPGAAWRAGPTPSR